MNYPETPQLVRMCSIWIKLVSQHTCDDDVIIIMYHDKFMPTVHEFSKKFKNVSWVKRGIARVESPSNTRTLFNHFNVAFKMFNLSKLNEPYISLDADMFVLKDLSAIYNLKKPFIAVNHQKIPHHTEQFSVDFLNGGLQIINDPSFLNFEDVLKTYLKKHEQIPGHEQKILYNFFKNKNYDYTHPDVGPEWNSCAGHSKISKVDDRWCGVSTLKDNQHPVYINHYWDRFKPWRVNCPIYNEGV